jgi:hypothetical protein
MDTILLLVILALAASGGDGGDASPETVGDPVYSESQTSKEQWNAMRQHPELAESSGEQKPYAPSMWSWLFKKPVSKERAGAKAKVAAGADKKGEAPGDSGITQQDESIKTKKNTTSALKAEVADDANNKKKSESVDMSRQQKTKE